MIVHKLLKELRQSRELRDNTIFRFKIEILVMNASEGMGTHKFFHMGTCRQQGFLFRIPSHGQGGIIFV